MAKIHKSAMVYLDSDKPFVLNLPELAAGLREKVIGRPDAAQMAPEPLEPIESQGAWILENASLQASRMISAAQQEAAQIQIMARAEGYQAGRQLARQAQDELEINLKQAVWAEIDSLRQKNRQLFEDLQADVLELSLQIAEKITALELSRNDSAFLSLVSEAMTRFKQGEKLNIQISKNDYWRSIVSSIYAVAGQSDGITLLADESLPDGSCLIEAQSGIIDASVAVQLGRISAALRTACQEDCSDSCPEACPETSRETWRDNCPEAAR